MFESEILDSRWSEPIVLHNFWQFVGIVCVLMWCGAALFRSTFLAGGEIYARALALSKFSIIFRTTNPFEDSPTNDSGRFRKENYPL